MWEKQWARKFNTITLPEETQPGCNNQLKSVFFSNTVTTTVSEIMIHLSEKYNKFTDDDLFMSQALLFFNINV